MSYDPDALPVPPPRWRIFRRLRWLEQHARDLERCLQLMNPGDDERPPLRPVS